MAGFIIDFLDRKTLNSKYDWANITFGNDRVGKARCLIEKNTLVIYSINVYPEFSGHGYGKGFVEEAKKHFDTIIADRVRFSAIGFWEKMGFVDNNDGNWIYKK